jgi:hypothetical protein
MLRPNRKTMLRPNRKTMLRSYIAFAAALATPWWKLDRTWQRCYAIAVG